MIRFFYFPAFCLLNIIISLPVSAQDLGEGLLLHYAFEGDYSDSSENSNDGIPYGTILGEDRFGNPNSACYFDGIDDYIDFPNLTALKPELPVSFSFWIKYDNSYYEKTSVFNTSFEDDYSSGVFFTSSAVDNRYGVGFGDGSPGYSSGNRRSYGSERVIDTSEWHQIVVVVSGALDMKIYVDCRETGGHYGGTGGSLSYSLTAGSIGRHDRNVGDPGDYFEGNIDDFRYWNRALTVEEVQLLCQEELSSIEKNEPPFIKVYPTPLTDFIHIESKGISAPSTIKIFNLQGQLIYTCDYREEIPVDFLSNGTYILTLETARQEFHTKFFVVR